MNICFLEHEPESPPGLLGEWALNRGHAISVLEVPGLVRWPEPADTDLIVSLGSDKSVHADRDSWIRKEFEFIRGAREAGVPVLGICFGAQLLAAAHGGAVRRAPLPQAEWRVVVTRAPELISPGPWFRWHEDVLEPPPGARLLAGRPDLPMAFSSGGSIGLQFHPEVDRCLAEAWLAGGRQRLVAHGISESKLRSEILRWSSGARHRSFAIFDSLSAWLWRHRSQTDR